MQGYELCMLQCVQMLLISVDSTCSFCLSLTMLWVVGEPAWLSLASRRHAAMRYSHDNLILIV